MSIQDTLYNTTRCEGRDEQKEGEGEGERGWDDTYVQE
jgi:hypothetical protein